ncbi:hypothetical protein QR680_018025 [Steinernema hermaphroditum]|uniref:G-protein coupled receptors family 1 profile domain-containing protein n=1 Tax=Steinernema hermaphroditum TaxID=289476 RepID=A0AA39HIW1_9BILA|nr:hypothetical protein QR680_018025 [Steinernema hermaphroditum]
MKAALQSKVCGWDMADVDLGLCRSAQEITGSDLFIGIQWFRVVVSTIACFCSLSSSVFVIRTKLYHSDLRFLTVNSDLPCIAYCALTAYRSASYIRVYITAQSSCDFAPKKYACGVQMAAAAALYQTCISSVFVVAVERTIATCTSRTYEHKRTPVRTFLMAVASWWQMIITLILYLTQQAQDPNQPVKYCSSQSIGPYQFDFFNNMLLPTLGLTILLCAILYFFNRRMNKVYHNSPRGLSHGYQLHENIHTTRSVLISASLLLALTAANFATALTAYRLGATEYTFAIIKELTNVVIAFYSIGNLVQFGVTRALRHGKRGKKEKHLQADNVHNYSTSKEYFEKLNEYWMTRANDKKPLKKKSQKRHC